jgi:hypothetical protein
LTLHQGLGARPRLREGHQGRPRSEIQTLEGVARRLGYPTANSTAHDHGLCRERVPAGRRGGTGNAKAHTAAVTDRSRTPLVTIDRHSMHLSTIGDYPIAAAPPHHDPHRILSRTSLVWTRRSRLRRRPARSTPAPSRY